MRGAWLPFILVGFGCGPTPELVLEDGVAAVAVRTPAGWSELKVLDRGLDVTLEEGARILAYRSDALDRSLPDWRTLAKVPLRAASGCEPRLPTPDRAYVFRESRFVSVELGTIEPPTHPDLASCRSVQGSSIQLFAACDRSLALPIEREPGPSCAVEVQSRGDRRYRAFLHRGGGCIQTRSEAESDWRTCTNGPGTASAWLAASCPIAGFTEATAGCPVEVRPRTSLPEPQALEVVPGGPREEGPDLGGVSLLRAPILRTGQIHGAWAEGDGLWVTARERFGPDVHCGMPGRGLPESSRWSKIEVGPQGLHVVETVPVDPCASFLQGGPEGSMQALRPLGAPDRDGTLAVERVSYDPDGTRTASIEYRIGDFGADSEIVAAFPLEPGCGDGWFVLIHDPFDDPRQARGVWLWDDGRSEPTPALEDRLPTAARQLWPRLAIGAVHRVDARRLWLGLARSTLGNAAEAMIVEVNPCDGDTRVLSSFNINDTDNIQTTLDFTSLYPSGDQVGFTTVFPLRAWGRTRGRDALPDLTFHYAPFQIGPSSSWSPERRIASVFQTGEDVGSGSLELWTSQVDVFDTARFRFEYAPWQPADRYGAPTAFVPGRSGVWGIASWTGRILRFPGPELP